MVFSPKSIELLDKSLPFKFTKDLKWANLHSCQKCFRLNDTFWVLNEWQWFCTFALHVNVYSTSIQVSAGTSSGFSDLQITHDSPITWAQIECQIGVSCLDLNLVSSSNYTSSRHLYLYSSSARLRRQASITRLANKTWVRPDLPILDKHAFKKDKFNLLVIFWKLEF